MQNIKCTLCIILFSFLNLTSLSANSMSSKAQAVAHEWANITYVDLDINRKEALNALYSQTKRLLEDVTEDEDLLTWCGIIAASYAGEIGGLKALSIVKKSKLYLERAMEINPDALNGGARTSLGVLYYQVPSWPIGFGNNKKAEKLLMESVKRFPNEINTLYFFASFLIDQGRSDEAIEHLKLASMLKPRKNHLVADNGRLQEIRNTIIKIKEKN